MSPGIFYPAALYSMNLPALMSAKKPWIFFGLSWIFLLLAHVLVLSWSGFAFRIIFLDSLSSAFVIVLCGYVASMFFRFFRPGKSNFLYGLLWIMALSAASTAATKYKIPWEINFLWPKHEQLARYFVFLEDTLPVRFIFSLLIISFMSLVTWIWSYWKEQQEKELKKSDAGRLAKEAELARLRLQLQPHFLFNSLNSVNALIGSNPSEARTMIQELSDFMRSSLKKDDEFILFEEELQHLQLYLNIEKVRFGHRLELNINVEDSCRKFFLPPLLLQPIVENAIKFGLYNTTGKVEIKMQAKNKNGSLEITTENPFDPNAAPAKGTGFGIASVQRRLQLLFGRNDLLKTLPKENSFVTQIIIPQKKTS
jgi:two-component system, LytTR family, sensor kinase